MKEVDRMPSFYQRKILRVDYGNCLSNSVGDTFAQWREMLFLLSERLVERDDTWGLTRD